MFINLKNLTFSKLWCIIDPNNYMVVEFKYHILNAKIKFTYFKHLVTRGYFDYSKTFISIVISNSFKQS